MRQGVKIEHLVSLSVAASAEAIGAVEEIANVSSDRIFQRGETAVVTGALQPNDIGLREVLIAAADFLGHVDIADIRSGAEGSVGGEHQILEASGLAGSDVEDAADIGARH